MTAPRRGGRRRPSARLAVGVALAAVIAVVYQQVGSHSFVFFDGDRYIVNNAIVRRGLTAEGLAWAFTTTHAGNWHPVTWLSHMLDVSLFGLEPGAHHLANVAIHAFDTLLLFLVLARMTGTTARSAFVEYCSGYIPCKWSRCHGSRSARTCFLHSFGY